MPIDVNDIIEGLDPSVMAAVSGAQLLQMVRNATPSDSRGLVIVHDDTPDTTTYPRLKRYGWIKPSENPPRLRIWNWLTSAWVVSATVIPNGTITNAMIANNTIGKEKLAAEGANKILRMNAAGTLWITQDLVPDANTVTLAHLKTIVAAGQILAVKEDNSGWETVLLEDLIDRLGVATVDFDILSPGVATATNRFLRVNAAGTQFVLDVFNITDIVHPGAANKIIVSTATTLEWQDKTESLYDEAVLKHIQSAGVDGGTFTGGSWQVRTLNNESDISEIVTLAANQFTIGPGVYEIEARVCANLNNSGHQSKITDITNAAKYVGTSEYSNDTNTWCYIHIPKATYVASTTFQIESYSPAGRASFGYGKAANVGETETYLICVIKKFS